MPSRKVTLLLAAAVIGIGTVMAARGLVKPAPQAQQAAPVTEIAAAARDLPTGTILKSSDVKWIEWAAGADTSNMYVKGKADLPQLEGAVVRQGMQAGDPVLTGAVVQPHDRSFLAAVLAPGMRAMSISLSPTAGVAGFVFPGDRVDVILTHSFSRKDVSDLTERRVSEVLLQDVRVLALDQRSSNQNNDPKVAQVATLEVTDQQAEKLALAADLIGDSRSGGKGSLSLVLRSLASADPAAPPKKPGPTWDSDVSPAYPAIDGEDGLMQRVQVMRGKNVTEDTFERHR